MSVYGFGINDAGYPVNPLIAGKRKMCDFYKCWSGMIRRCQQGEWLKKHPTYEGCTVSDEWIFFSNFRKWMTLQDWVGKELDKDILFPGNRIYGPDHCVFISKKLNGFLNDHSASRGDLPLGVDNCKGRFRARCSNPFTGNHEHLGVFSCPENAHEAWLSRKKELALEYAIGHEDHRVTAALCARFSISRTVLT